MTIKHQREISVIQDLASRFLSRESNRTSLVTVTSIELNDKGDRALIRVTVFPEDKETEAVLFLKRMRSDFRKFTKQNSKLPRLPTFDFEIDKGEKNRQRVEGALSNDQ